MMRLSSLLSGLDAHRLAGPDADEVEVRAVVTDSRAAGPGSLFVAIPGTARDGHAFVETAATQGAAAVVVERAVPVPAGPAVIQVPSARAAVAALAARLHGDPARRLPLVGITGTNGKTSVAWLLAALAREAGRTPGVVGTLGWGVGADLTPTGHTTPAPETLHGVLAGLLEAGADLGILEVSSHALSQERVRGLGFAAAAFTNLSRDHLDFHPDMEAYFEAKRRLFTDHLAPGGVAVVSLDDPWGRRLAEALHAEGVEVLGTRLDPDTAAFSGAEVHARTHHGDVSGLTAEVALPSGEVWAVRSPMVGRHNLANLLTAVALAWRLGFPEAAVLRGLAAAPGAPGRLERVVDPTGGRHLFVDYAHTDDALRRVIGALRELAPPEARVIVVFGAGGDRDRGKRPLMGQAASAADRVVVTSDNPRHEDPQAIIQEILAGLDPAVPHVVEPDRARAIALACAGARPGDVVLVAGKGHERGQQVGDEVTPFDDREVSRRALADVAPLTRPPGPTPA